MVDLSSHHPEAGASLQLLCSSAKKWERNPRWLEKTFIFSYLQSLAGIKTVPSHFKILLLLLHARLYMPKTPVCILFSALKESILEVTEDVLSCGYIKKRKNLIIREVIRNPPLYIRKVHPSLQEDTIEENYM